MRDIHCHIVPGVDDGSRDMRESLAMVKAATAAGITEIVATPHCRGNTFSMRRITEAFTALQEHNPDVNMTLAYEVYYDKLVEVGIERAGRLCNQQTGEFLLELPRVQLPIDFERTVFNLQALGLKVIIAHPERYLFVQKDVGMVEDWVAGGCALQTSADFIEGGLTSKRRKTAQKLISRGLVKYIASDAHCPEHYDTFKACRAKYGSMVGN